MNNELFLKICKDKSKNAEFSLRFSKNVSQLNEILSVFELNANVHFSMRTNALSIAADTFEIAANHIYDSKKEDYRLFQIKVLSSKEKNSLKVDKKEIFGKLKKKSNEKRSC